MNTEEILTQVNFLRKELDRLEDMLTNVTNSNNSAFLYKSDNFEYPSFKSIESDKEQKFIDLVKDGIIKIDEIKYPDCIFLFKNGNRLFKYILKSKIVWFDYDLVWLVFEDKHSMSYGQIEEFMKDMVGKHFNCKNVTPFSMPRMKV